MSKKATLLYITQITSGGVLYPAHANAVISIAAQKMYTVRLNIAQQEGWVNELIVKQQSVANGGGTSTGFAVELLDSKVPYYLNSTANIRPYSDAADVTVELFRVFEAQKTATAGNAVVVNTTDYGYPFYNGDGASQTAADKYLYLTIIPTNSLVTTKWEISFTYTRDIN